MSATPRPLPPAWSSVRRVLQRAGRRRVRVLARGWPHRWPPHEITILLPDSRYISMENSPLLRQALQLPHSFPTSTPVSFKDMEPLLAPLPPPGPRAGWPWGAAHALPLLALAVALLLLAARLAAKYKPRDVFKYFDRRRRSMEWSRPPAIAAIVRPPSPPPPPPYSDPVCAPPPPYSACSSETQQKPRDPPPPYTQLPTDNRQRNTHNIPLNDTGQLCSLNNENSHVEMTREMTERSDPMPERSDPMPERPTAPNSDISIDIDNQMSDTPATLSNVNVTDYRDGTDISVDSKCGTESDEGVQMKVDGNVDGASEQVILC